MTSDMDQMSPKSATAATRRRGQRVRAARMSVVVACLALVLSTVPSMTPAEAAGRLRTFETGKVKAVADGDTLWIDIAGDHSNRRVRVRMAGIQATEIRHQGKGKNWCHGRPAKSALARLVLGKKVQLRGKYRSSRSLGRPLRYVFVKQHGSWVDVQQLLLQSGQAMGLTLGRERTNDALYGRISQQAARNPRGLWSQAKCGAGPAQDVPLRTWVHWDADGNDYANPNGEYAVFENQSSTQTLSLRGWGARDSSQALYAFPAWASIPPASSVRLHSGRGTNTETDFYWNLAAPVFQNPDESAGTTEFAVLMDPQGDFRSWATYPCRTTCTEPLASSVRITRVDYDPEGDDNAFVNRELIVITNTSREDVRLDGYYVQVGNFLSYTFASGRVLPAGESINVRMGRGSADSDTVYMNQSSSHLANIGGTVQVRNWNGNLVTCRAWGAKRC